MAYFVDCDLALKSITRCFVVVAFCIVIHLCTITFYVNSILRLENTESFIVVHINIILNFVRLFVSNMNQVCGCVNLVIISRH